MMTFTPCKAISFLSCQLKGRLKDFLGDFSSIDSLMTQGFNALFEKCVSLIRDDLNNPCQTSLNAQVIREASISLWSQLSEFSKKMQSMAVSILKANPDISNQELDAELKRRVEERIDLIARTQMSALASSLQESVANDLGYEYFVWLTKKDERVGKDHAILEGAVFRLDDLPIQGFPQRSRPNCRCQAYFIHMDEETYKKIRQRQLARGIAYA